MLIKEVKKFSWGGYLVNGCDSVPEDPHNSDFQAIQAWIKAGNKPELIGPGLVVDKEAVEREALIQQKMRKIAIRELQTEGKLTTND